jgi:hypothetical protein
VIDGGSTIKAANILITWSYSNEKLHGLYSSPSIVRVIKARRTRWAGHVARMGEVRGVYNIFVGRPEGGDH